MSTIIEAQDLRKQFVRRTSLWSRGARQTVVDAVKGLSFAIGPGEFVGFLGPNGAGKSTTIKMMTGILSPSGGSIVVDGLSPQRDRVCLAHRIGVIFGQRTQLWWDLPLIDSFRILRAMYRVPKEDFARRLSALDELLDITPFLETPVRQLSLGQRMRGELVGALLHQPAILFLDEPTIGLDITAKAAVRRFLRTLNEQLGTTVILTTHDMSDVEALCRRIIVINQGVKVFDGDVAALHAHIGAQHAVVATYRRPPDLASLATTGLDVVPQEDGVTVFVQFDRNERSALEVLDILRRAGELLDFSTEEPALEAMIRRFYE